jgi:hypothetical protein
MEQGKTDELQRRVDEVLVNVWDPIGVCGRPGACDEYSSYSKTITRMLAEGRDAYAVAKYLEKIESGMLALPANSVRLQKVVDMLLALRDAVEQ